MKGLVVCARRVARLDVVAFWVFLGLSGQWGPRSVSAQTKAPPAQGSESKPAVAGAEEQARAAFERGRIHYDNGEFARAASAFEEAYRLSGREGLLYNLYLAYRDANQQENAAEALRNYLAKVEVIENRAQLEARLQALDAGIAQRKAEEAQAAEEQKRAEEQRAQREKELAAKPAEDPSKAAATDDKWWRTPVIVMGAGGALMAGSLPTGLLANSKAKKLDKACVEDPCDAENESTAKSGKTLALVTDILLFSGLATAVVGGVLMLLKRPKKQPLAEDSPRASVSCTRAGCAGSVSLRF